jgi:hypothetical protein
MTEPTRRDRIQNIIAMADNLHECPANEQFLAQALAVIEQGFRDIAEELQEIRRQS